MDSRYPACLQVRFIVYGSGEWRPIPGLLFSLAHFLALKRVIRPSRDELLRYSWSEVRFTFLYLLYNDLVFQPTCEVRY